MPFMLDTIGSGQWTKQAHRTVSVGTTTANDNTKEQQMSTDSLVEPNYPHLILLDCIRHLQSLNHHAISMINRLFADLKEVDERTHGLRNRLHSIHEYLCQLPLPDSDSIEFAASLQQFFKVKTHYRSTNASLYGSHADTHGTNLFLPVTRSHTLQTAYAKAGQSHRLISDRPPSKSTESNAVQTECDEFFSNELHFSVDFCRPRPRRKSSFDTEQPLPTPEEKLQKLAASCKPTTLEVDLPSNMLRRVSQKWKSRRGNVDIRRINYGNYDSVVSTGDTFGLRSNDSSDSYRFQADLQTPVEHDTIDAANMETVDLFECPAAKEYLYDFAPFYRRRTLQCVSGIKRFLSLRRPKKQLADTSDRLLSVSSPSSDNCVVEKSKKTASNSKMFDVSSIKCMLKKSLSFKTQVKSPENPYGRYNARRLMPVEEADAFDDNQDILPEKINLPISTSSQVINVANLLRQRSRQKPVECNGYATLHGNGSNKRRPVSISSCDSQTSLTLGNNKTHSETYHTGYKINYPYECLKNSAKVAVKVLAPSNYLLSQPTVNHLRFPSISTPYSPSSLRSTTSSAVESTYSCDQEGYFTSMHHDSGLPMKTRTLRRATKGVVAVTNSTQCQCPIPGMNSNHAQLSYQVPDYLPLQSAPAAIWHLNRVCTNPVSPKSLSPKEWASVVTGNGGADDTVCSIASAAFPATVSLQTLINKQDVPNGMTKVALLNGSGTASSASSEETESSSSSPSKSDCMAMRNDQYVANGSQDLCTVPGPKFAIVAPQVYPQHSTVSNGSISTAYWNPAPYPNEQSPLGGLCSSTEQEPRTAEKNANVSQPSRLSRMEPLDQWLMAKFQAEEQELRLKEARALEQVKLDALVDLQRRAII